MDNPVAAIHAIPAETWDGPEGGGAEIAQAKAAAETARWAAADLARVVAEVEAERDEARRRADRLDQLLRCERGEWAPEGWERTADGWERSDGRAEVGIVRGGPPVRWHWTTGRDPQRGEAPWGYAHTALEAIDAANAALAGWPVDEIRRGSRVRVTLPPDVEGWAHGAGASWAGAVVALNGDSIDVRDDDGVVEPVDAGWVVKIKCDTPIAR